MSAGETRPKPDAGRVAAGQSAELREVQAELTAVLDAAVDAFILIDESGAIEKFNRSAERMFGYRHDEVVGRNVSLLMPSPFREEHDRYMKTYLDTGTAKIIGIGREASAQHRDGRIFPVDIAVGEMHSRGKRKFVGIIRDISIRKNMETTLRQREQELMLIFDNAAAGVFTCDLGGRLTRVNPFLAKLLEQTGSSLIGTELLTAVHPDDHDTLNAMFTAVAAGLESRREAPLRLLNRHAEVIPVSLHIGVVKPRALGGFIVGQIFDKRKEVLAEAEARELRERMAHFGRLSTMGEMASGIAHEINQPLTAISAYAEACKRMYATGIDDQLEFLDALEQIVNESSRASEIIRRLRSFVNKGENEPRPIDLNAVIKSIIELADLDARARGVSVMPSFDESIPVILADPIQIQQVVLNLVRNAIEAMEDVDSTSRSVRVRTVRTAGDMLRVSVENSGPGIPEEVQGSLFMPFFTTKAYGTGLGLMISRSIVEAHGGQIWHESPNERTTAFCFTLPISMGP